MFHKFLALLLDIAWDMDLIPTDWEFLVESGPCLEHHVYLNYLFQISLNEGEGFAQYCARSNSSELVAAWDFHSEAGFVTLGKTLWIVDRYSIERYQILHGYTPCMAGLVEWYRESGVMESMDWKNCYYVNRKEGLWILKLLERKSNY